MGSRGGASGTGVVKHGGDAGAPVARPSPAVERRGSMAGRVDLRLALLAGPTRWRDPDAQSGTVERIVVGALLGGAAATLAVALVAILSLETSGGEVGLRFALTGVMALTLGMLMAPSVTWAAGRRPHRRAPAPLAAAARVVATAVALGCFASALGRAAPLAAWLPGIVAGSEATLTFWALGLAVEPYAGWRRFELSSVHLGMLVAVAAVLVANPGRIAPVAAVYAALQVLVAAAAVAMNGFDRLRAATERMQEERRREAVEQERRRLAHWIHDDVSTALRLTRLRLAAKELTTDDVREELEDLDHRIRLRQLDEVLASGTAQLAEVLQPYVRVAQENGVDVTEVPRFDRTSTVVDEATGRRLLRALAVIVPNAIQSGASSMACRISEGEAGFSLEVEDDAGGVDLGCVPAGRGLDGLRRELGEGALEVTPTGTGSVVRVRVSRGGGSR